MNHRPVSPAKDPGRLHRVQPEESLAKSAKDGARLVLTQNGARDVPASSASGIENTS
jgi:hypothetical protein